MLECHAIGKQWEICIKTNRSFPIQQKSWILLYGHEWSRAYRLHIPGSQSDNLWISYKYFTQETSACRIARSEVFVHFQFLGFFSIRKRAKKNRVLLRSLNSFNWDKLQNYRFLGNFGLTARLRRVRVPCTGSGTLASSRVFPVEFGKTNYPEKLRLVLLIFDIWSGEQAVHWISLL